MKLRTLKNHYKQELATAYPEMEIDAIFSLLVEHYLRWNKTQQVLRLEEEVHTDALLEDLKRLKLHVPVQYIVGKSWFFGLELNVNDNVLIPRPETEQLVQWIIDEAGEKEVISDICSGSGCISIALFSKLRKSNVTGLELSSDAIDIARRNEEILHYENKISWVQTDVLDGGFINGNETIVVSNPPYIPHSQKELMPDNVKNYEPHLALFVPDDDPLLFYRIIGNETINKGQKGVRLYFEIHEDFCENILNLLEHFGFTSLEARKDMQGKNRIIRGVKP